MPVRGGNTPHRIYRYSSRTQLVSLYVNNVNNVNTCHHKSRTDCYDAHRRLWQCMSRITDSILMTHEDLAFVGDMNCCPSKSDTIKTFCDLYNLSDLINEPTCFKGSTPSILDVILVTNPRRYISTLNARCYVIDFHNIIGAATKRFAPEKNPANYILSKLQEFYRIRLPWRHWMCPISCNGHLRWYRWHGVVYWFPY